MESNQIALWETENAQYRVLVCQCGCGETFQQSRVGRVRVYKDNAHKRRAQSKRNAARQSIGDVVGELLSYLSQSFGDVNPDMLSWLEPETAETLVQLHGAGIDITSIANMLDRLHERYCR